MMSYDSGSVDVKNVRGEATEYCFLFLATGSLSSCVRPGAGSMMRNQFHVKKILTKLKDFNLVADD
jgi:hypothetical protein